MRARGRGQREGNGIQSPENKMHGRADGEASVSTRHGTTRQERTRAGQTCVPAALLAEALLLAGDGDDGQEATGPNPMGATLGPP